MAVDLGIGLSLSALLVVSDCAVLLGSQWQTGKLPSL